MKSKPEINHRGNKIWKLPNSKQHREDGAAIEYSGGSKEWWLNGGFHREDGPAAEWCDGTKEWYLNGIEYTEKEHKVEMRTRKLKELSYEK